jgi:hypothetical protein
LKEVEKGRERTGMKRKSRLLQPPAKTGLQRAVMGFTYRRNNVPCSYQKLLLAARCLPFTK